MVFKPFKPPLIRKPSQPLESTSTPSKAISESDGPPAKKQRVHQLHTAENRKPLLQVKNTPGSSEEKTIENDPKAERYFNVLWYAETPFTLSILR